MKKILPLAVLVLASLIGFYLINHYGLSLQLLQAQKETINNFIDGNFLLATVGFLLLYALVVALSLPIASLLTLSSGFFFGTWLGGSLTVLGATIGATIIFWVAKTSLGESLRQKAKKSKGIYNNIASEIEANQWSGMLFLRLIPAFPFFLVNIVPAFFNVSTLVFFITTLVGIAPASFIYANIGTQLGSISSLSGLVSPNILLAFTGLGLLALLPVVVKKIRRK
ncbi:MAG: VTT domain-containing protein [Hydrotalea sp.]|nr:VTT domain-containing protein [Hydrotalea sp.]